MKIISKYQDFYEYEASMYGSYDNHIVWKREPNEEFEKYISDREKQKLFAYLNKNYIYHQGLLNGDKCYNGIYPLLSFTQELIGIYPYVYLCMDLLEYTHDHSKYIPVTCEEFKDPEYLYDILIDMGYSEKDMPVYVRKKDPKQCYDSYFSKQFKTGFDWVIEDPKLFDLLNSPVFQIIKYPGGGSFSITTNINIVKDTRFFKHYKREEIDQNVYTNIEQFIIEKNTKKITEPDNKTKIINAGFDLKTSFRNM